MERVSEKQSFVTEFLSVKSRRKMLRKSLLRLIIAGEVFLFS